MHVKDQMIRSQISLKFVPEPSQEVLQRCEHRQHGVVATATRRGTADGRAGIWDEFGTVQTALGWFWDGLERVRA